MKGKKGQVWETLIPWIIGLLVLVVILMFYFFLSGKGQVAIDFIKNLFRFGR